jgi:PKHD-type hydroxylase
LQALVLQALEAHSMFFSAALPKRVLPPLFNRYSGSSNSYGDHVDQAVRYAPGSGQRVRTDISCTLFLTDPASYDGGELVVQDTYGEQRVKLNAGDMVLYPGTSVHRVEPVTRGERLASFFWIESMVRADDQRRLLYELDMSLMRLRSEHGESEATVQLTGTYHNLLRMWADT